MEEQYVFANVKIPLKIKPDGQYEPLQELIQIEFSECNELPKKRLENVNIMNELNLFLTPQKQPLTDEPIIKEELPKGDDRPEPLIYEHELKQSKSKKNTSFKYSKTSSNHRYTAKSRI
jgi:hypothetical protein